MRRAIACSIAAVIAVRAVSACKSEVPPPPPPSKISPQIDATPLIEKYECARCHEIPRIAEPVRDKHCFRCHQDIHDGKFEADADVLAKWRGRITSLRWAPSLANADRLDRDWIREFLLAPRDIRPELVAEMPHLGMSRAEAHQIAAHLAPEDDVAIVTGNVERGEAAYRARACGRCHRFIGASVDDLALHAAGRAQAKPNEWALAPDLRHARERVRPSQLAAWIHAPRGAMPDQGVPSPEAMDLAAFIANTPLATAPRLTVARLPVLQRRVTYDEVEREVFHFVCWHCHAVPEYAGGDGGPGKSGGFGFPARGLDLSSYAGISSGALDDAGEVHSVFAPLPDGTPRIVAHLLARYDEERGVFGPIRGMPLGLPPLPLEKIQLVDSWIAQGRPQ